MIQEIFVMRLDSILFSFFILYIIENQIQEDAFFPSYDSENKKLYSNFNECISRLFQRCLLL